MAQDADQETASALGSGPDSNLPLFDDDISEPLFFDEPPAEQPNDALAGEANPENEIDTFPYTPNVFGNITGHESDPDLDAPEKVYLPMVTSGQMDFSIAGEAAKWHYVDCSAGNDGNSGLSSGDAWKSLSRANEATLNPGDRLLLKRGCSWTGPLDAKWQGTSSQPIIIGAYGSGALPKVQNAYSANVRISGQHQIIQDIHATLSTPPNPDPNCNNQPRGWKSGFSFEASSSYNTVRAAMATRLTIGVFFHINSHHNRLLNSTITDNNVLEKLTSTTAHGATGVSLHGNHNEIARNYFANNRSLCTYNGVVESNSIELYTASNSNVHHNTVYNDRVFVETGSTSAWTSQNNTFAYNLHVTDYAHSTMGARFVVTRGYGHNHGPVLNTVLLNNVVYFTGSGAKGLSCQMCGNSILTARNNVLWAEEPFSTNTSFIESHNVYWDNDGKPGLRWRGFTKSSTSHIADPQFTNAALHNFTLKQSSPAINSGTMDVVTAGHRWDLPGKKVPIAGAVDIGGFEAQ